MASIRQREGKRQASVRRKGFPDEVKTFTSRQDAERRARYVASEIDEGCYARRSEVESTTLTEVIERYIVEVCPFKRGCAEETIRLRATCHTRLAKLGMAVLTPMAIAWSARIKRRTSQSIVRLSIAYRYQQRRRRHIRLPDQKTMKRKPLQPTKERLGGDILVERDDMFSAGGEGGEASQADGRGGRGGRAFGAHLFGSPDRGHVKPPYGRPHTEPGRGGDAPDSPRYMARKLVVMALKERYSIETGIEPRDTDTVWYDRPVVPLDWLNETLRLRGHRWTVSVVDGEYEFAD